jgi:hypothetical protein
MMCFRNQHRLRQIFITGHIIGIVLFFLPMSFDPGYGWYSELADYLRFWQRSETLPNWDITILPD